MAIVGSKKKRLSEVIDEAIQHGPQIITRHGEQTAVVISYDNYRRMLLQQKKLSAFFRDSPLVGVELAVTRDRTRAQRNVDL